MDTTGKELTLMTVMARFSTEEAARAYFEGVRWANGRSCPHCGNTDESRLYTKVGQDFATHETVNHSAEEYARTSEETGARVTTNTVEGFFGNAKRSLDGTHHAISRKHTGLYFAELDHKYNTRKMTDGERTVSAIRRMEGKRLMLRTPKKAS